MVRDPLRFAVGAMKGYLSGIFLMCGILKFQAFPDLEGDVLEARLMMSQGTPLQRTEEVVHQITEALDGVNEQPRTGILCLL